MATLGGVLSTHQVLLNVVIPLWLVEETDAPRVLLAWLFGTNTVMAVLLQVAAARGITTVADSLRAQRRGAFFFVLSCGIVLVTHDTVGWITIALVWLGHVTVTGAELFTPPASGVSRPSCRTRSGGASTKASPSSASPSARCGRRRSTRSSPCPGARRAGSSSPGSSWSRPC